MAAPKESKGPQGALPAGRFRQHARYPFRNLLSLPKTSQNFGNFRLLPKTSKTSQNFPNLPKLPKTTVAMEKKSPGEPELRWAGGHALLRTIASPASTSASESTASLCRLYTLCLYSDAMSR